MEEKERFEWNSRFDEAIKDNQTGDIVNAVEVLNKQDKRIKELEEENQQLKQQLAEKDKEIEQLKYFKVTIGTMENNQVDISSTTYIDQDKISFAIEQLEKVKNIIKSKVESIDKRLDDLNIKIVCESTSMQLDTYEEISKEIDNQIESLKKGVE